MYKYLIIPVITLGISFTAPVLYCVGEDHKPKAKEHKTEEHKTEEHKAKDDQTRIIEEQEKFKKLKQAIKDEEDKSQNEEIKNNRNQPGTKKEKKQIKKKYHHHHKHKRYREHPTQRE